MRRLSLLSLLIAAIAVPVFGQRFERVEVNNLVQPLTTASSLIIPVAGSTAGGFGTYFRSEIHLINFSTVEQRVNLLWVPSEGSGANDQPTQITLPGLTGVASDDFVVDVLHRTGLGSIVVLPVNADGSPSSGAKLHAVSRIWTRAPNSEGTYSQTFPSIPLFGLVAGPRQLIPGTMRVNSQFRMNVGLINLSSQQQHFIITFLTGSSANRITEEFQVDLPAFSMRHMNLPTTVQGAVQITFTNDSGGLRSTQWLSYASNVDNISGDAWSYLGFNQPE
jgi:hypothetical protein